MSWIVFFFGLALDDGVAFENRVEGMFAVGTLQLLFVWG
jgi:hypothetical protein